MYSHVLNRLSSSLWATWQTRLLVFSVLLICILTGSNEALAHAVTAGDKGYIQEISESIFYPLCTWALSI